MGSHGPLVEECLVVDRRLDLGGGLQVVELFEEVDLV